MFEMIPAAPDDPILGLVDAFQRDPNPAKVDLTVGVYQDATGQTPIPRAAKQAESLLLGREVTKKYLPIGGTPQYAQVVQKLLLGELPDLLSQGRAVTAHTPGGTGAVRLAADLLHLAFPTAGVWISEPTWPNHNSIFQSTGFSVHTYPYFDPQTNGLPLARMLATLEQASAGDIVLLQGCCHNPTGIDPTPDQWRQIAELIRDRQLLPLIDFAYQGLAEGLHEDTFGLRTLCQHVDELIVCSSFSKNFGLYNERAGALTLIARDGQQAAQAYTQIKARVRASYSNPPFHGGAIVVAVLSDPELRGLWEAELKEMRERIIRMRRLLLDGLVARGVTGDLSYLQRQRGMFSLLSLTPDQVRVLREQHAVYIVGSGRANVAGLTENNIDRVCDALAAVWH